MIARVVLLVAFAIVAASCTGGGGGELPVAGSDQLSFEAEDEAGSGDAESDEAESDEAESSPDGPTTTSPAESTTLLPRGGLEREVIDRPRALITPTGVVVPVVGTVDGVYEILTPCGEEASIVWGTPVFRAEVALDAGHGGQVETGAQGPNGLVEKELNLALAKATATELNRRGISVVLTRTADYRIPLSTRAAIANELEVKLMVSIHHNAPVVNPSDGPGTEVFVQSGSPQSRRLGGLIYEEVVAALEQFEDVEWVSASDAGALAVINRDDDDSYGMIRRPEMPAVLAEFGYLANATEAELFATQEYLDVTSVALAEAIERWLETDDPGSGFVDEPRRFTPDGSTGGSGGCVDPPLE